MTIAENYIEVNGYNRKRINLDSTQTTFDILELMGMTKEQIEEARYNTLQPKAYRAYKNWGKWWVIFEYNKEKYGKYFTDGRPESGRVVSMNCKGGKLRLHHQDMLLQRDTLAEK